MADRDLADSPADSPDIDLLDGTFWDSVGPIVPAMARLAARLAPHADRDDIVQEALARAWQKRNTFDPHRGSLSGWLLAITADRARKSKWRPTAQIAIEPAALPRSLDHKLDVEDAVANLAPRQRLAVNCFYFSGLTVLQTAAVMRCTEGTVKSTLADARARLREVLEDHE